MMACNQFTKRKDAAKRAIRAVTVMLLVVTWAAACERKPIAPGPATPPRPQTVSSVTDGDVQSAVFTYEAPASKSGRPVPPVIDENYSRLQV